MGEMTAEAMEGLATVVRKLKVALEKDLSQQLERRFLLSVPLAQAGLAASEAELRARLEAWLAQRAATRASAETAPEAVLREVRSAAESEVAANVLLRLFLLRQLEACGVSRPALLSGGWSSKAYLEFRSHAPGLTSGDGADEYEGLDFLLALVFDELAVDLPGIYGEQPLDPYFELSPAALREVINALNAPELASAWDDDTTLGWVYQFWNDPRREAIDERVGPRGRIAPHEIASKTQLFSERYMVEWLLQNSVGRLAVAMRDARGGDTGAQPLESWPFFVDSAARLGSADLPSRLEELRILDPACGSGHFLAGAFDLLVPLYRDQAREFGEVTSDERISASILEHNLHGIDIDGRAVQVAAAVLYLKAKRLSRRGRVPPMNLVSATFELGHLTADDPALAALLEASPAAREQLEEVLGALRHVGFLGSLMRFRRSSTAERLSVDVDRARELERFVLTRTHSTDLGVRFDGTQLAAGLRLRNLLVEGRYDVVVFNPPYLATSKLGLPAELVAEAFGDAPDLFAAFVDRALELCKPSGLIAFVALSNWMFLSSFQRTRERVLEGQLLLLADIGKGAFRRASKLIQSAMVIASPERRPGRMSVAARVGSRDAISVDQTTQIVRELQDSSRFAPFDSTVFGRIEGSPLLFWLDPGFLRRYAELPKIGEVADGSGGIATTDNERFLRAVWEVPVERAREAVDGAGPYVPYLKGAEGREWFEPFRWLLRVENGGLELRLLQPSLKLARAIALGVAYTTIGHRFGTRLHTVKSVRDVSGASVFAGSLATVEDLVCALNRTPVRELASALNPTVNFQLNDIRRLPFHRVEGAAEIVARLRAAFATEERANELSLDYQRPGPSPWRAAQGWAQRAVDRREGVPLPPTDIEERPPAAWQWLSHALGVTLGRFDEKGGYATDSGRALEDGILFLGTEADALERPACRPLREAWATYGAESSAHELAAYLRTEFFATHRQHYEGKPIYLPLSSARRSYVAYVCFHRFGAETLSVLLAEHLVPERRRREGELADLREARRAGTASTQVERRFTEVQKLLDELNDFIRDVTELVEKGPPAPSDATPRREVDAAYRLYVEDGVQVSSAGLWSLLDPQWKEPRKWWTELATAKGKKDFDWSRLAARYFPSRVRRKCAAEPSLAAAQGWLWELHPAVAYAWELRLQEELGPHFVLDEPGANEARTKFSDERATLAGEILEKERKRRSRRSSRAPASSD